jgi:hypothetical protein
MGSRSPGEPSEGHDRVEADEVAGIDGVGQDQVRTRVHTATESPDRGGSKLLERLVAECRHRRERASGLAVGEVRQHEDRLHADLDGLPGVQGKLGDGPGVWRRVEACQAGLCLEPDTPVELGLPGDTLQGVEGSSVASRTDGPDGNVHASRIVALELGDGIPCRAGTGERTRWPYDSRHHGVATKDRVADLEVQVAVGPVQPVTIRWRPAAVVPFHDDASLVVETAEHA